MNVSTQFYQYFHSCYKDNKMFHDLGQFLRKTCIVHKQQCKRYSPSITFVGFSHIPESRLDQKE